MLRFYTYAGQGKYAKAEALNNQILDIRRRVSGPEHPETLKVLNNLANVYLYQGKSAEAVTLIEQVLDGGIRSEKTGRVTAAPPLAKKLPITYIYSGNSMRRRRARCGTHR